MYYEDLVTSVENVRGKHSGDIPFENGDVRVPEGTVGIGNEFDIADFEKRALDTVVVG